MTPKEFRAIRRSLGLTQKGMAKAVRIADDRSIRGYEGGDRDISGPLTLCLDYIMAYGLLDRKIIENNSKKLKKLLDKEGA